MFDGLLNKFRRRDDDAAAAESVTAAGFDRHHEKRQVVSQFEAKYGALSDDKRQFLLDLLDKLGPLLLILLKAWLKV